MTNSSSLLTFSGPIELHYWEKGDHKNPPKFRKETLDCQGRFFFPATNQKTLPGHTLRTLEDIDINMRNCTQVSVRLHSLRRTNIPNKDDEIIVEDQFLPKPAHNNNNCEATYAYHIRLGEEPLKGNMQMSYWVRPAHSNRQFTRDINTRSSRSAPIERYDGINYNIAKGFHDLRAKAQEQNDTALPLLAISQENPPNLSHNNAPSSGSKRHANEDSHELQNPTKVAKK